MYRFKGDDDFWEYCGSFASELLDFVESISGNNRWWFEEGYWNKQEDTYSVIFKSYITPEFRKFMLSIYVQKINGKYEFKVLKQITDLV